MTKRTRSIQARRSTGRFFAALVAMAAVFVGVPLLLVVCSRAGLGASHPLPSIGSSSEIADYLGRGLSTTEVTSIALRGLLIIGWLLWLAMVSSVLGAIIEAARGRHPSIPQFRLFGGLARWIASGLVAASASVPSMSSVALAPVPPPATPASASTPYTMFETEPEPADGAPASPILGVARPGFEVVRPGESPATFAQRVLGDSTRWRQLFELNQGREVGPFGEMWTTGWKLSAGWELKLPSENVAPAMSAPSGLVAGPTRTPVLFRITQPQAPPPVVDEHVVVTGESYWAIAEEQLGDRASGSQVYAQTQALMDHNAPRLGYADPAMIQPGDVVQLLAPGDPPAAPTGRVAPALHVPHHVVVAGDSYWSIANQRVVQRYGPEQAENTVVYELMVDLIALNAPLLGYDDFPELIHPGDIVYFEDPATYLEPETPPPASPPAHAPLPPPSGQLPAEVPVPQPAPVDLAPVVAAAQAAIEAAEATMAAVEPVEHPAASEPSEDDDGALLWPMRAVLGLSALATAGAAAMLVARRRRAGRGRPHQRPAPIPERLAAAAEALTYADCSDVAWLALELRWLVHQCSPPLRASLMVEEIQVGTDRDVEIAFATTPLLGPPPGWTMAAERIWQLDRPHTIEELALYADMPPLLPCLVTLGHFEGGQLYCNLENHPGINVSGDAATAQEGVTSVVWEVAGGGFAEHPTVLLVDVEVAGAATLDAVEHVTATEGLARFAESAPSTDRGMLDRRTEQFDGWDTTLVVLGAGVDLDAWSQIAARQNVAVISLGAVLPDGLELVVDAGRVTVPRWNLTVEAVGLSASDADRVAELLDAADAPPVPDELEIPVISEDAPRPIDVLDAADPASNRDGEARWEPPVWPVTVRLLAGAPRVAAAGGELRVKPQPLAGLAYLAIYREVALDDLRSAIWGDDQQVKPQRLRDLLSELRKQLGGAQVVGHIEDGVVRAGPDLGSDLAVFEALAERARQVPAEAGRHLAAIVDLVEGQPFAYPSSAAAYWRWVDLSHLHAVWQHRIATAAYELAELHLSRDDPNAALRVAEQGLLADPFNGPLTEMVITAYGRLGAYDTARRVFEAHDRALTDRDLGGACDETRRVLDHLLMATATAPNGDTGSPAGTADRRAVAG